jgi:hypothetical protein
VGAWIAMGIRRKALFWVTDVLEFRLLPRLVTYFVSRRGLDLSSVWA